MTIVSAAPASSTPWTTLSAKRPSVVFRLTTARIQSPDAAIRQPPALTVLLSLRELERGGTCCRVCHPRTQPRARAERDPRRPLRPEPPQPAAASATTRPPRADPGARRRDGRGHAARPR